jgi:hypothetical protein
LVKGGILIGQGAATYRHLDLDSETRKRQPCPDRRSGRASFASGLGYIGYSFRVQGRAFPTFPPVDTGYGGKIDTTTLQDKNDRFQSMSFK